MSIVFVNLRKQVHHLCRRMTWREFEKVTDIQNLQELSNFDLSFDQVLFHFVDIF